MARRRPRAGDSASKAPGRRRPTGDAIEELRLRIDAIDRTMVRLLNERAGCAIALGRVKKERGLPIYQPAREEEVLSNVRRASGGPLDSEALRRLFERIIDESRRIERIAIERDGRPVAGGSARAAVREPGDDGED
ncbi:MAG TPA: chorismate mutase [Candidatus Polarisedimenticolia bacterium]|nr:chorismate mutase [Candidatus Polarisedimenticolia bacterium]